MSYCPQTYGPARSSAVFSIVSVYTDVTHGVRHGTMPKQTLPCVCVVQPTHLRELKRRFVHKLFLGPDSGPRPNLPVNQSEHRNTGHLLRPTPRRRIAEMDTCSPELRPRWQSGKMAWAPEVKGQAVTDDQLATTRAALKK